jgi:beta-mannosidase
MKSQILKILPAFTVALACMAAPVQATHVISLDGDWEINGFDPQGTRRISGVAGRVPGHVHPDLQRAGIIADPFWRDQADLCQWVEHWEWRYSRTFQVPADFPRRWVLLQFDGLDTFATILLNGKQVGTSSNMFIPHEFEITNWLKSGVNTLEVHFAPAVASVADKPRRKYFAVFDAEGVRPHIRRMQCSFGWDWVHRLVSAGIWQPCRMVAYPDARVEDLFAWTSRLTREAATLNLELTAGVRHAAARQARFSIADPDGRVVWEKTAPLQAPVMKLEAQVPAPRWWWPNGAGAQPLYRVSAALLAADGTVLDRREIETGLRTVTIEQVPDAAGPGRSFTLLVNGVRIFAKGGNWVPADPFPSRITADHYARLLGQARAAGLNMLRAWGGGLYEPEAFWRACDRLGIMVSQDFLLACADYPEDDPAFTGPLKREFAAAIRMLRNHPSLVFWCGDNELGLNSKPGDDWSFKKFHEHVTAPLVAALDPSRVFRPTSPFGGPQNNSPLAGDCHINSQVDAAVYDGDMTNYREQIDQTVGRFMSEHAAGGAPPKRTLLRFMTERDLAASAMWEYHTSDNPYIGRERGLTLHQLFRREAGLLYGDPGADVDRSIRQMEYLQYEYSRRGMEASRRRKFWCSGIQLWMFNDCWPAIGWSIVDYWGGRKAGWYGQAAGCRPVIAAQEVTTNAVRWWVCNDLLRPVDVELVLRAQPWQGAPRWTEKLNVTVPANTSQMVLERPRTAVQQQLGSDAALVCDLKSAEGHDRSWWFPGMPKDMRLPPARLHVTETRGEAEGRVTIHAENWARVVTLDADLDFSDNYFELLPGESRTITWQAPQRPFVGEIRVSCWNP